MGTGGKKHVVILGSGITGLTAAEKLARWQIGVSVIEKSAHLGGHAVQYTCKATDQCVKCGACLVQQQLQRTTQLPGITFYTGADVREILSGENHPHTINLLTHDSDKQRVQSLKADAVLVATGFQPFNPKDKPFGYGHLANVITNLELERMLRAQSDPLRPSDHRLAQKIAFIQCVGSRDASLGHRWCSQVCCASALRMARLIQHGHSRTQVSFFYIDVQSVGKNFQAFHQQCCTAMQMVRAIPGEIIETPEDHLKVIYFDPQTRQPIEETFDLVVLSIGMLPASDNHLLSETLHMQLDNSGFFGINDTNRSVFSAGTARGPMSIADCIGSAGRAAWDMLTYLQGFKTEEKRWPIEQKF